MVTQSETASSLKVLLVADEKFKGPDFLEELQQHINGRSAEVEVFVIAPALASSGLAHELASFDEPITQPGSRLKSILSSPRNVGIEPVGESTAKALAQWFGDLALIRHLPWPLFKRVPDIGGEVARALGHFLDQPGNQQVIDRLLERGVVRLDEIATITREPRANELALFERGDSVVELQLQRSESGHSLKAARILDGWLEKTRPTLPPSISLEVFDTQWQLISDRIELLIENGLSGLLLVVAVAVAQMPLAGVLRLHHHDERYYTCLLYTSPSPRDRTRSRMPSSA